MCGTFSLPHYRANVNIKNLPIDSGRGIWYNGNVMSERGKFIVFEGTDGSGKSTQMSLLGKFLKGRGVECVLTREPTDSPFGALLRACMTGRMDTDERAIAALFAADRLDHILNPVNGIKKVLEAGKTVLCDRYYFSSFAYNGNFVPLDWVIELNRPAMEALRPDLVVFLDLSPEEGMRRVSRRGETDRYETLDRQKRIRENYFAAFARFRACERVAMIASEEDKARTQENVQRAVLPLFGG